MDPRHLFWMKRWVQNPPSLKRIKFIFAVAAIAAVIFGLEYFGLWPEWAKTERLPRRPIAY